MVDYPCLALIDGDYYYFAYYHNGLRSIAVKNYSYWLTKTNGLMPEGSYTFDEDGKMLNPPVIDPGTETKDGIVECPPILLKLLIKANFNTSGCKSASKCMIIRVLNFC